MTALDWLPAISTTGFLAAALWLLRSVISTRLTASVQDEFEQRVEMLRTSLRKSEESFKAELRSNETQIEALRTGALSVLASRQAALDARRIVAVEQLWSAVQALAPAKAVSATIAVLRFDEAMKVAAENPKARDMFTAFGGYADMRKLGVGDAEKVRPFVSEMAWALFSAYQSILAVAMLKMELLKTGLNMPTIVDKTRLQNLISVALPHQATFAAISDTGAYHYLLDELESSLLGELRRMLQGGESDKATVLQAAKILKASESLNATLSQPSHNFSEKCLGWAGLPAIGAG